MDERNKPEALSLRGLVECRVKRLEDLKPGDIVKRDHAQEAYAVDSGVEQFREGPAVIASRRVLIDNPAEWRVYRPKT